MKSVQLPRPALALAIAAATASAFTAPLAVAKDSPRALAPQVEAAAYQVRIGGPAGFILERTYLQGEPMLLDQMQGKLDWTPGEYVYEIVPVAGVAVRDADDQNAKAAFELPITTGSFRVHDGEIVMHVPPKAGEVSDQDGGATDDQVIADDLIVQGSACVGIDCVNNESFGFDTIRMKENNTRIKFEDTSVGTFPSTDWQLTANDSASGGLNKFSIEDITAARNPFTIEGGATTNSIYVDSTGRIGFRTSTPVLDLHVNTNNTPGIRLEQNNSGGFTAQTWDIAGNEANFFIRDVTGGSRLPFRIRPGAPTSSIDIAASGNVGIGTASPTSEVHIVRANNGPTLTMESTGTPARAWQFVVRDSDGDFAINDTSVAGAELILKANGDMTITGSLTASGSTFPDYVFDSGYKLMPLSSLESFIEDNGHLPNIPSAKDVEAAGGHNMTELQLKLLEKVEELTLYTLQQQERIEALEGELRRTQRRSRR